MCFEVRGALAKGYDESDCTLQARWCHVEESLVSLIFVFAVARKGRNGPGWGAPW